ncbi:MAG: carboxypeptidase M32 [Candidatus Eisenbacteria bacterium]|uniref:Metal-dependent carboxypeptidase n=1 Tax=Eiseniibacteriota bacterium TaxID=2212470 RepID=A0A7Y2ECF8_UNCEI|nr:carboxypeptidase M32 [Candidatus Eisenbacteria bacterium]
MTTIEALGRALDLAAEISDIESAEALLSWDQETKMPKKGVQGRSKVSATLAGLHHEKLTQSEIGDLLNRLRTDSSLEDEAKAQVVDMCRSYDRATKIPSELVKRFAEVRSQSTAAWAQAREAKNFTKFAPHLEEVVSVTRELAEAIGYDSHPYDALVEEYEPGATIEGITQVLEEVKSFLVPYVQKIGESGKKVDLKLVEGPYDVAKQEAFGREVVLAMGFDLEAGRIDPSAHPFCSGIHGGDVRLTTRYKGDIRVGLYGTIHEAGHGLYEQGVADSIRRTPIGSIKSLGIHESQSRLWENNIGLGRSFWTGFYPSLQKHFPEQLGSVALDDFYSAVNDVRPTLIRIEADEVTYNLHIVIRFEIEKLLMENKVAIRDLPELWNSKYKEYLGITPPSDDVGVLQDIHWGSGLMGYFPTYTLGSLNAAQFCEAAQRDIPDLEARIAKGELSPLKDWLVENVHKWGSRFSPEELVTRATGKPTSAEPFIRYIREKYDALYNL